MPVSSASTKPRWLTRDGPCALILIASALLPQLGTWSHDFVEYDDPTTITQLPLIRELSVERLPEFFRPTMRPGLHEYMPLKNLSYALDYALFGLSASGFRWQQQIWYALSVLLFWRWLRALLRGLSAGQRLGLPAASADALALASGVLFALHPAHVESVTWLSGRKDLLCGAFMFASLLCAFHWREAERPPRHRLLLGALVGCALALLSKPMAVVLPLLVLLQDAVCRHPVASLRQLVRERAALYAGIGILSLGFALFYISVVPLSGPVTPEVMARLYSGPALTRVGQQLALFAWFSLSPAKLAPMLPPDLLDPDPGSPRALLGYAVIAALLGAFALTLRRRHPLALAIGLFVIPLLPILATPPWAQYVAGRYMYLAVAGVLFALVWMGAAARAHRPHLHRPVTVAGVLLVVAFTAGTLDYNREWRDGRTLWQASLEKYPRFTALHKLVAHGALKSGDHALAETTLRQCLEVDPLHAPCNTTLGIAMLRADPEGGERLLRRALQRDVAGEAHFALARYLADTGRAKEAVGVLQRWLSGHPASPEQLESFAAVSLRAGDYASAYGAVRNLVRARVQRDPASPPPSRLLAELTRLPGAASISESLHDAIGRCTRSDCVQRALGW